MANVQPRTLSGFMELLPARQVQFDRMVSILRETYSLYGFTPLDTPLIEASEVLLAKAAGVLKAKIGQAAFAFNALPVKAVRTIDALREKQQGEAA